MKPVAVLPEALANQIAAGEVVERPASVVKELIENAIDADATRIVVEVEDGGRRLIRVVDNGHGMTPADAALAIRRHATSKIVRTEDLGTIHTLGFRGEALPSIASVSRFRLTTRSEEAPGGTAVAVVAGELQEVGDVGCPVGTQIAVEDLFFNVPARLKFLKQRQTEVGHIKALIKAFGLAVPHVHLKLTLDGRKALDYPPARRLEQRLHQVLGAKTAGRMHPVDAAGDIAVRGLIGEPTYTRTNQHGIHTFVNGRHVRDRVVTHAIVSAYGERLPRGYFPYAALYVHIRPDLVDVNVHPTKAEIRFMRPAAAHDAIAAACRTTLLAAPWRRGPGLLPFQMAQGVRSPSRSYRARPVPSRPNRNQELVFASASAPASASAAAPAPAPAPAPASASAPAAPVRVLGQVAWRYLAYADATGLHLVDQHEAHARTLAARLRGGSAAQPLLFPAQVEVTPAQAKALDAQAQQLAQLGFQIEPFGGATWHILTVPAALSEANPAPSALAAAAAADSDAATLPARLAQASAVPAGKALDDREAGELVRGLLALDEAARSTSVGGRLRVSWSLDALARAFRGTDRP